MERGYESSLKSLVNIPSSSTNLYHLCAVLSAGPTDADGTKRGQATGPELRAEAFT
jgi:hypothetical protein